MLERAPLGFKFKQIDNIYEKEFNNRVRYLITKLKNDNLIENVGSDKYSIWK